MWLSAWIKLLQDAAQGRLLLFVVRLNIDIKIPDQLSDPVKYIRICSYSSSAAGARVENTF